MFYIELVVCATLCMTYPGASEAGSTLLRMLLSSYVLGQKNSEVMGRETSLLAPQLSQVRL